MAGTPQRTRQTMEVELEAVGDRSGAAAFFNSILTVLTGGIFGASLYRFVGHVEGAGHGDEDVLGATFPLSRFGNLDDGAGRDAWTDTAADRLRELDEEVQRRGWSPVEARGEHWWSRRYARELAA